ncbi:MAG: response regulator transcription factor [Thermoanaerobaculia bacterium]|nr:response regulator transcription factor [Thermoanaerobaculia bacterium]
MIRVCLVEDQHLVRRGIRTLLDLVDDIEVVAEAADGPAAVTTIESMSPDVVLLDLRLPELNGIGVLRELGKRNCLPPTIILTTFDDENLVVDGIRAGARGFLLKDVSLERLAAGIRTVAAGGSAVQPALTERLLDAAGRAGWDFESLESPDPVTEREVEVLRLITGGYSNREIASLLGISEGTVKNHISSILSKLGVRDRTRAVLKGLELRLI